MDMENVATKTVILTTLTVFTIISVYFYEKWKKQRIPKQWVQIGTIKKVYLYPLKSGNRIELERAQCTETGLKQVENDKNLPQLRDRGLVVYGAKDNEFRTARTYPKMVKIDVSVHDQDHLAIDAPTMRTLYVKIPKNDENNTTISLWRNEKINGVDCGDEAASWFSRYIIERDSGLRLAYHNGVERRNIEKTHKVLLDYYKNLNSNATGLFSDLSSILLINQKSVNDMNRKIGNSTISCENFRPNLVVDGSNLEAYEEDKWDWIKIGDAVILRSVKECTRCILTTINPATAIRNMDREPLKTLETYRKSSGPEKTPIMGINLGVKCVGLLKIGDPVYISLPEK